MTELDVDRPCYPATTHRYRRVGKSDILCCIRCGQGKLDIVGTPIAAVRHPFTCEWCDGEWSSWGAFAYHFSSLAHKNPDHPYQMPASGEM